MEWAKKLRVAGPGLYQTREEDMRAAFGLREPYFIIISKVLSMAGYVRYFILDRRLLIDLGCISFCYPMVG